MKKMVRENLYEALNESSGSLSPEEAIEFLRQEYGEEIGADQVASYVDDNWAELTGLTNRDKDEEGYFPNEVEEILDELNIDYDDYSQEWIIVREGAEDWEDEEDTDDEMDPEEDEDY